MKIRRLLAVLLACAQLSACVSVDDQRTAKIRLDPVPEQKLEPLYHSEDLGSLKVRSIVYKPSVLPMGTFLKKLADGNYKAAFHAAHLKYSPSNVDDEGIRTLIRNRFIPVLVDVTNTGRQSADLKDLRLTLEDETVKLSPLPAEELPKDFESFNPKAAAANVYNTGVVVVTAAAFLALVAACIYAKAKNNDSSPLSLRDLPDSWAKQMDREVYNSLHKTTNMEYSNLLWAPTLLERGKSARGLLFFKLNRPDWSALQLKADLKPS